MAASVEPRFCRLHSTLGRAEVCPGTACAFWDPTALLGGRCAIDDLDLAARPELAEWLLQVRAQLETPAPHDGDGAAREELYRLLSTGDADGG